MGTKFYDSEAVLVAYLKRNLPVPVGTKVPKDKATFVKILRTGGIKLTPVSDNATVVFECYGATDVEASSLCSDVRELLALMPSAIKAYPRAYRVLEMSGPANLPDPFHTSSRYSMTAAIHLRGQKSQRSAL